MKALEFIYQDTEIHFLVNPLQENVMVNATEMAKAFEKRLDVFLKTEPTKKFIELLENHLKKEGNLPPVGGSSRQKSMHTINGVGTYFHRIFAIKFAAWLDPEFELWVYKTIDEILFGHYKEHWDAHVHQEKLKIEIEEKRNQLLLNGATAEQMAQFFELERELTSTKNAKTAAIRNQLRLFDEFNLH